jgi:hypothetical protein
MMMSAFDKTTKTGVDGGRIRFRIRFRSRIQLGFIFGRPASRVVRFPEAEAEAEAATEAETENE